LKPTRAGQAVIAIAFAVGFAAFNTGNNLLFLGWGMLLSSIVISGILSEATLRAVSLSPRASGELRSKTRGIVPFTVANHRRTPAFAVEVEALFEKDPSVQGAASAPASPARSFELRIEPGGKKDVDLAFTPQRRGKLTISEARALTAFPFGFFQKEKRVELDAPLDLVVLPARLDVLGITQDLLSRIGEAPARRAGPGDELFSLRPFRTGDDPRRVAWRRSARTNRLVVKETEAARSRDIVLELHPNASVTRADLDHAIDVCGSLAEDLLSAGHAVGLRIPGVALVPAHGPRQRSAVLTALALLEPTAIVPPSPARRASVIAVSMRGGSTPAHAEAVIDASRVPEAA